MKNILITFFLIAMPCSVASAQWIKVYQTDSCHCSFFTRWPIMGMEFFGNDSGVVCAQSDGLTALTLNGGETWNTISGNPNVSGSFLDPITGHNYCFLDVNHIWFCNGWTIYHTSNGGGNWELDTNKASIINGYSSVQSICFIDSLNGFEGGAGYSLYRTSDGGKNWSLVYDSTNNNGNDDGGVYQIQFCTPKLGIALSGGYLSYILRTTDGGITWLNNQGSLGFTGNSQPAGLSYPDPNNAWFADAANIYHSSDSGATWLNVFGQIAPLDLFYSISFLDSLHGIATANHAVDTGNGGIALTDSLAVGYTSDGGKSWQTWLIASESSQGFTSFPGLDAAYIGGYDAVYKLNVQALTVRATPTVPTGASIVSEDGNLFVVMPQSSGGRVRIVDALGRVLSDEMLLPGGCAALPNSSPDNPKFRFVEVECNGIVQVFKVLN
jgi:photosystem II stability/assembly factor-like uncharacterized protein